MSKPNHSFAYNQAAHEAQSDAKMNPYNTSHQIKSKGFGQMLFYLGLVFLVIAVSLDGFGVGISYGIRNIRVPIIALLIIMLYSGIVVFISMTIGNFLDHMIPTQHANILGGLILVIIGLFSLTNALRASKNTSATTAPTTDLQHKENMFTTILLTPDQADWDQSGLISPHEALLLGIALALDAFGAGIGASIIGYSPVITAILVSSMSGVFVYSGMKIGLLLSKNKHQNRIAYIAPLLLIILGMLNMI